MLTLPKWTQKLLFCFIAISSNFLNAATPSQDLIPIHEALVPKFTDPIPLSIVQNAPPAPVFENVPTQPYPDFIWIPGYWSFVESVNDYVWICGVWRRPPTDLIWIPGSWNHINKGWVFARGFWSTVPIANLNYINATPPPTITDNIPPSPGNNYFFIPGFWNYSASEEKYEWLSGKWELSNPDWILAPSSYVWRPSGFVFVPSYWDWPLEGRGVAYSCSAVNEPLVAIEPTIIVQRLFFYYPDYTIFYWHWWHHHPEWGWDGCDCVPPWWGWHDWWSLGWGDSWGLWWWWGHPGALPPFWLSQELSNQIAPPPHAIIDVFKKQSKPKLNLKFGDQPWLPKGTPGKVTPLPVIPNHVKPQGNIHLPKLPNPQVKVPKAPPASRHEPQLPREPNYPPQRNPQKDNRADYRHPDYPPQRHPEYPLQRQLDYPSKRPPDYRQPYDHGDNYTPPGQGSGKDHGRGQGSQNPTPPSSRNPNVTKPNYNPPPQIQTGPRNVSQPPQSQRDSRNVNPNSNAKDKQKNQ